MNTQKVEKLRKEKGITIPQMAAELGMDASTYYRKMKTNGDEFSAADLMVFKRVLGMSKETALDILL